MARQLSPRARPGRLDVVLAADPHQLRGDATKNFRMLSLALPVWVQQPQAKRDFQAHKKDSRGVGSATPEQSGCEVLRWSLDYANDDPEGARTRRLEYSIAQTQRVRDTDPCEF